MTASAAIRRPLPGIIAFLLVILASCKKEEQAPVAPPLVIGQEYQGGHIIFIDSTGQHGLIASADLGEVPWCNGPNSNINTSSNDGVENTSLIIDAYGPGTYAAYLCDQLDLNGYSDWYLPASYTEAVYLLYLPSSQRFMHGAIKFYWSSTQNGPEEALRINMNLGGLEPWPKQEPSYVCAIRKF